MKRRISPFAVAMHDNGYDLPYQIPAVLPETLFLPFNRTYESLDGEWKFTVDPYETGMRKKWFQQKSCDANGFPAPVDFDFDRWENITVPSCFNLQKKEYLYYEGMVWYTRTFPYQRYEENERAFLLLEGVNYECRLWLNGKYLLRHLGGSTPCCIEITDFLMAENRIIIMANNQRKPENIPAMNTDWFNYGGVYRSVLLYRMPNTYIKDAFIRLVPDGGRNKIAVSVSVDGEADECRLEIPELNLYKTITLKKGSGETVFSAQATLWYPEAPKLYQITLRCGQDIIKEEIGFKDLSVHGNQIFLNGSPIFLRGISFHEDHPETGKTLDQNKIISLFQTALELNCNFVRLAHYPHSRLTAKIADRLGLLLWEEIPVYWAIQFENPNTLKCARSQLKELVYRDRNRVSVGIWSVGNENPDTDERLSFMGDLIDLCHSLDNTRPVSAACLVNYENFVIEDRLAQLIDIIGINEYFGWYRGNMDQLETELSNISLQKPVVISEFGAGALSGHHGTASELFTEECQAAIYEKQTATLKKKFDVVCGMTPWVLFDFRSPGRTNYFQQGYNRKGLLSPDYRLKKLAFYTLQNFYRSLKNEIIE